MKIPWENKEIARALRFLQIAQNSLAELVTKRFGSRLTRPSIDLVRIMVYLLRSICLPQ